MFWFFFKCEFSLRINATGLLPCCAKTPVSQMMRFSQDLKCRTTANTTVSPTCVFNKLLSDNLEQTIIKTWGPFMQARANLQMSFCVWGCGLCQLSQRGCSGKSQEVPMEKKQKKTTLFESQQNAKCYQHDPSSKLILGQQRNADESFPEANS